MVYRSEKRLLIVTGKIKHTFVFNFFLKVHSIKSRSFSFIKLWGNVVYRLAKIISGQTRRTEPSRLQFTHVEQSSFIQIVDMNRFFTGNPVSVRLIDYRKKS